jgi:hypothetical protein
MYSDEEVCIRIRQVLKDIPEWKEKRMFGGMAFLVHGNMACGVHKGWLISRVGPEKYPDAISRPHTKPFDITGKPMSGWVMVGVKGYEEAEDLKKWVQLGMDFAQTLPPK